MPDPNLQQSKCGLVFGLCVYNMLLWTSYSVTSWIYLSELLDYWKMFKKWTTQTYLGQINKSLLNTGNHIPILEEFCED